MQLKSIFPIAVGLAVSHAFAIAPYSLDTFQNGTLSGWSGSTQASTLPSIVSTGGPAGANDKYLRVKSNGGTTAGGKLSIHNETQWAGDYVTNKITAVELDVKNEGTTTIKYRFVIEGISGARFVSTVPVTITPNSGWIHIAFPINSSSMTLTQGAGTLNECIATGYRIWLRHSDTASNNGSAIVAQIGVDNIFAIPGQQVLASSYIFGPGLNISGNLTNIVASDNSYLVGQVNVAAEETGDPVTIDFELTSPYTNPTAIDIISETKGEVPDIYVYADLLNWNTGLFEPIGESQLSTIDVQKFFRATGNFTRFVKAVTKQMRLRFHFAVPASETDLPWKVWIDRLTLQVSQ